MDINRKPDKAVPVSVLLPHWQIGIYVDKQVTGAGKGFLTLSIILLGIFIAAIVSGGGLLTWQAYKNMKDAGQKTSFVSSVSHELKTPLTSIRMYAELLLSGRVTDQKKIDRYHSVIVAESRRLTRLINNVLDFGKLEQGKKTYSVSSFDLRALLLSIIDAHSIRIKNAGFKIETDLPETVFAVKTDPDAIEQAVLNLVENALKYAAQGKVVRFVLEKGESVYLLKICDRGPGISQKHQRQVFHKFYRIDDSLTSAQPGSGLGLSIARQILRDLGGDLVYEPRKDKGSCFILRIPMS